MYKIKSFLLLTIALLISTVPINLFAQNIYWIESVFDAPRLVKTGADGTELLSKSLTAGSLPQGIAINSRDNTLLWTSLSFINAHIMRISTDFNSSSDLGGSHSALRGIAIDPVNQKIYWISTNLNDGPKIQRANLDGTSVETLIDFGAASNNTPRSISLDVAAGKMYWTNFGKGKIQRADMVVGALPENVLDGLHGPSGLAVDTDSAKIFWTEMNIGQIKSSNLNGQNIVLLADNLSYPNFIAINRSENRMAWTERGSGKVKSAALDGSGIFDYGVKAIAPTGIAIEPPQDTSGTISGKLAIVPRDTTIQTGNFVHFQAQIIDTFGIAHNTSASWYDISQRVGPITKNGSLFAFFPGRTFILAKRDSMIAFSRLKAVDTTADSSGINKIKITDQYHHRKNGDAAYVKEGNVFTVAGAPFPYNILNGAMIYFPKGSLHEDITLEVKLPKFCRIKPDSVEFLHKIIGGIQFNVYVKDSLISPYYFDKPISLSLPVKRGILKHYGINPADLAMYFAEDSLTFDSLGISHVMVNRRGNRIYGQLAHFSTLAIHEKLPATTITAQKEKNIIPEQFVLKQNYPNPFNPVTTITYQLPVAARVELTIYNMLGQKVTTLVSGEKQAGTYKVQWDAAQFASGVYIYKLQTNKGFVNTKKLLLLK